MPRFKPPYPPEFRSKVVELARSGRTLSSLAKEFGVTDVTLRSWLRQADLDVGRRSDGLTTEEKQELARLRKEVAKLRQERDILEQAAAWFAQEAVGTRKKRSDS
jgi:transposase-like protein